MYKCNLCGKTFDDFGNNPYPLVLKTDGLDARCCDACNGNYVIPVRIACLNLQVDADDYAKIVKDIHKKEGFDAR